MSEVFQCGPPAQASGMPHSMTLALAWGGETNPKILTDLGLK
jgi:hypothetical protein